MQTIPLDPVPAQTLGILLNGQSVSLRLRQTRYDMFIDVYVANTLIVGGVVCQNLSLIVRNTYLGFVGDLAFYDTQGDDDPTYEGLGSRFVLLYLLPSDVVTGVAT